MKTKVLNRKVSWAFLLGAALLVIVPAQQLAIHRAHANERAADTKLMQLGLENSALRLAMESR